MFKRVIKFRKDESGAALAEYGILVALIAVVAVSAVTLLGTQVNDAFEDVAGKLCGDKGLNADGDGCAK